jgi:hypothetical protein
VAIRRCELGDARDRMFDLVEETDRFFGDGERELAIAGGGAVTKEIVLVDVATSEAVPAIPATACYIRDRFRELMHPNEPWISPGAARFCATYLTSDQIGLEWGSGRSTRWYAKRLGMLLSIESNPYWHAKVNRMIRRLPNVGCHPLDQPTKPDYDPLPKYVAIANKFADNSLDLDGHYRQPCIKQALPQLKPGGLLLVDDFGFVPSLPDWGVPSSWPVVHKSSSSCHDTIIWRKPKST